MHESRVSVAHVLRRSALHVRVACPRCASCASPRAIELCKTMHSAGPRASVLRTRVALPAPQVRVRASCVRGWLSPRPASVPSPCACSPPPVPSTCAPNQGAASSRRHSQQQRRLVPHYNPPVPPPISRPAALHDRALHAAMHERLNLLMRSASGSPPSPHPLSAFSLRAKPRRCFIDASRRAMHRRPSLHPLPKTNDSGSNALGPLPLTDFPVLASPPPPPFPPSHGMQWTAGWCRLNHPFQVGRTFGRYSRSIVYGTSTLHALRLRPPTVTAPDASQWACASLSSHVWCL